MQPNIVLDSVAMVSGPGGVKQMEVVLHNQGTAHAVLQKPKLSLKAGQTTAEVSGNDLGDILNANILAGNKRRFRLSWPAALGAGTLSGTLEAGYVR
ncbi:MAG: hypothetical protein HQ495_14135 [Alphaproteobacteria bacterium]|nr:hypothetical protein [Alphaproteobacteria bacterium]